MNNVQITKSDAIRHAKDAGIAVSRERTANRVTEIQVGRFFVYWDRSQGGRGFWKIKDENGDHFKTTGGFTQVGYVGEMILAAADAERAALIAAA